MVWRSYQLAPDTPVGARRGELEALVELKGCPPTPVRQMFQHVAATAAADGLVMDFDTVIAANTFDAHRLLHLAGERRDALLEALFRAHFTDGKVIDDRNVLADLAASVGMDAAEAAAALAGDRRHRPGAGRPHGGRATRGLRCAVLRREPPPRGVGGAAAGRIHGVAAAGRRGRRPKVRTAVQPRRGCRGLRRRFVRGLS